MSVYYVFCFHAVLVRVPLDVRTCFDVLKGRDCMQLVEVKVYIVLLKFAIISLASI